jgi:hypothetical protein
MANNDGYLILIDFKTIVFVVDKSFQLFLQCFLGI